MTYPGKPEDDRTRTGGQRGGSVRTDPAAFSKLYRQHYDAVFRYCAHRLFDRAGAEDVTSIVFLKAAESLRRFRGDERDFRHWLFKIAANAVSQHLRRTGRDKKLLRRSAAAMMGRETAESTTDADARRLVAVRNAMLALRPKYQAILTLRFFENMKPTDIAAIVGGSPATVRSQLSRALAALRKEMTGLQADGPGPEEPEKPEGPDEPEKPKQPESPQKTE